ncbi:MAG: transposase [Phycisphaerae bacterium]|nr:transposase [Phycisphaerae bacterium]
MGPHRVHRKSWDNDWDVHCLTFSTFQRRPLFTGRHAAGWFLDTLAAARTRCPFRLFAYVIMPEHVHLVLQPLSGVTIRTILWRLKRPLTRTVLAWVRANSPAFLNRLADVRPSGKTLYRFWQRGGGYDRNLRSASDVHEKIRYIHDNPVRRGLVARAEDWPHSSAGDWILQRPGRVPIDWDFLPEPEVR